MTAPGSIAYAIPMPGGSEIRIAMRIELVGFPAAAAGPTPTLAELPPAGGPEGPPVVAGQIGVKPGLLALVEEWAASRAVKLTGGTVYRYRHHVEALARELGWASPTDIHLDQIEAWLARKLTEDKWSGSTHDVCVSAVKGFAKWLRTRKGVTGCDLEALERINDATGPGSRAFTTDELRRVLAAALRLQKSSAKWKSWPAQQLAIMALCGLRGDDAQRLLWGDVDLGDRPRLVVHGTRTKARKTCAVPLNEEAATILREHRENVPHGPEDRVFAHSMNSVGWGKLIAESGITNADARGQTVGEHSCRKWFATVLSEQVRASSATIAVLMRRLSTIDQRHYIEVADAAQVEAVQALPKIWPSSVA